MLVVTYKRVCDACGVEGPGSGHNLVATVLHSSELPQPTPPMKTFAHLGRMDLCHACAEPIATALHEVLSAGAKEG